MSKQVSFLPCLEGAVNLRDNLRWSTKEFYPNPVACFLKELSKIDESLSDSCLQAAVKVCVFDDYRLSNIRHRHDRWNKRSLSKAELSCVRSIITAAIRMFDYYKGIEIFDFETNSSAQRVSIGYGDYITKDTLWDMKCSVREELKDDWTLQILIYYLLLAASSDVSAIKYIGILNPVQKTAHRISVAKLKKNKDVLIHVCVKVMGFSESEAKKLISSL